MINQEESLDYINTMYTTFHPQLNIPIPIVMHQRNNARLSIVSRLLRIQGQAAGTGTSQMETMPNPVIIIGPVYQRHAISSQPNIFLTTTSKICFISLVNSSSLPINAA
jgi:hypothetical protein